MNVFRKLKEMICRDCESEFERKLKGIAEDRYLRGAEMPMIAVYVSAYGDLHIIELDADDVTAVQEDRITRLGGKNGEL